MSFITVTTKGDYKKVTGWLERLKENFRIGVLDKYGKIGVNALKAATPVDSGATASMWRYEIQNDGKTASVSFHNDNINKGVNIALILQYGHGTGTGGWVEGRDYINPALQSVFDDMVNEAWKELTSV